VKITVIIPTYNAELFLPKLLRPLVNEKYEILIIDSSSDDNTVKIAQSYGVKIFTIPKKEFNHGGTRNLAIQEASGDILVYLTQDAIPVSNDSVKKLINPIIKHSNVGMAYGRQLPHPNADFFGAFARSYNYPENSQLKTIQDISRLGIKTVFASNSFAAYRKKYLIEVGRFPTNTILSEDTYVAARMIKKGLTIAYVAEAQVYHSHNYTIMEEFKRYFDIGVFYGREKWILKEFAQAEGEGTKFAVEQLRTIIREKKYYLIPSFFVRNVMKLLGYRLGIYEKVIPLYIKKRISMHKQFWRSVVGD